MTCSPFHHLEVTNCSETPAACLLALPPLLSRPVRNVRRGGEGWMRESRAERGGPHRGAGREEEHIWEGLRGERIREINEVEKRQMRQGKKGWGLDAK